MMTNALTSILLIALIALSGIAVLVGLIIARLLWRGPSQAWELVVKDVSGSPVPGGATGTGTTGTETGKRYTIQAPRATGTPWDQEPPTHRPGITFPPGFQVDYPAPPPPPSRLPDEAPEGR